jgi:20S proteasome alpha/beta subunit
VVAAAAVDGGLLVGIVVVVVVAAGAVAQRRGGAFVAEAGGPCCGTAAAVARSVRSLVTTFDPSGRLRQVEYAQQAAASSGQSVAAVLVTTGEGGLEDGEDEDAERAAAVETIYVAVVAAVAAPTTTTSGPSVRIRTTTAPPSNKVRCLDGHLWLVSADLAGDARAVAAHLRSLAQQQPVAAGEPYTVHQTAQELASLQHYLTHTPGARPLGVTCLVLGFDRCLTASFRDGSSRRHPPRARLYKCAPGGSLEDCLYCAAGQSEGPILKAL